MCVPLAVVDTLPPPSSCSCCWPILNGGIGIPPNEIENVKENGAKIPFPPPDKVVDDEDEEEEEDE